MTLRIRSIRWWNRANLIAQIDNVCVRRGCCVDPYYVLSDIDYPEKARIKYYGESGIRAPM